MTKPEDRGVHLCKCEGEDKYGMPSCVWSRGEAREFCGECEQPVTTINIDAMNRCITQLTEDNLRLEVRIDRLLRLEIAVETLNHELGEALEKADHEG